MPNPETLVRLLLRWFARHARDLPWRRTTDPYAIWISEIMLQQTQVKTVIPYWERWMEHFPSLRALAKARPESVLKLWEGLGYYSRVRNLHRAAQIIMDEHDEVFPSNFTQVLELPGVGRYTAGAICSIAFNQPAPVLDGNVIRVLTRVFGITADPRARKMNQRLWRIAEELVTRAAKRGKSAKRNCSALNQALMELGATVCTPRQPNCARCPLRRQCIAQRTNRIEEIPRRPLRNRMTKRRFFAFVIMNKGRVLLRQRPPNGVNAQLWEFPTAEAGRRRSKPFGLAKTALGFSVSSLEPLCTIQHTIMQNRICLEVLCGEVHRRSLPVAPRNRWCKIAEMGRLAFTGAHRRIIETWQARFGS